MDLKRHRAHLLFTIRLNLNRHVTLAQTNGGPALGETRSRLGGVMDF